MVPILDEQRDHTRLARGVVERESSIRTREDSLLVAVRADVVA